MNFQSKYFCMLVVYFIFFSQINIWVEGKQDICLRLVDFI